MKTNMDQQLAWFMSSRGAGGGAQGSGKTEGPVPELSAEKKTLRKSARQSFLVPSSPAVVSQHPATPKTRSGSRKKKPSSYVPMGLDDENESPLKKARQMQKNETPLLIDLTSTPGALDDIPRLHANLSPSKAQKSLQSNGTRESTDQTLKEPWNGSELFDLNDSLLEQFDTVRPFAAHTSSVFPTVYGKIGGLYNSFSRLSTNSSRSNAKDFNSHR
jgi:hypothetical protein